MKSNKKVLQGRPLKIIPKGRVKEDSLQSTEEFIKVIKEKFENSAMEPNKIINVDEFQIKISGYSASRGKITAVQNDGAVHKQITTDCRGGCIGSLVSFICANGSLLYSALCLKPDDKQRKKEDLFWIQLDNLEIQGSATRSRPIPQIHVYSESRMLDGDLWPGPYIFRVFRPY